MKRATRAIRVTLVKSVLLAQLVKRVTRVIKVTLVKRVIKAIKATKATLVLLVNPVLMVRAVAVPSLLLPLLLLL